MREYLIVFCVGGAICVITQLLMDLTKLTPARILVCLVTTGVVLGGLNIYDILIRFGKAGASIPLPGFGFSLAKSVISEVDKNGLIGIFTGGIKGAAGGITAAVVFGYLMAILFNPRTKE